MITVGNLHKQELAAWQCEIWRHKTTTLTYISCCGWGALCAQENRKGAETKEQEKSDWEKCDAVEDGRCLQAVWVRSVNRSTSKKLLMLFDGSQFDACRWNHNDIFKLSCYYVEISFLCFLVGWLLQPLATLVLVWQRRRTESRQETLKRIKMNPAICSTGISQL